MGSSASSPEGSTIIYQREGGEWGGPLTSLFNEDSQAVESGMSRLSSTPSTTTNSGVSSSGNGEEASNHDNGESGDLADSTVVLTGQDPYSLVAQTHARLARGLVAQCEPEDPFASLLGQRVLILQSIHAAITASSTKEEGLSRAEACQLNSGRSRAVPSSSASLPPAVGLALHLLYSLLDFVRDDICEPHQRADFLKQVAPMLSELPPLCLSDGMASTENISNHDVVLDSLRDFLYLASLPSACFLSTQSSEENIVSALETSEMIEQRTEAATALLGLASARGRASDLLLAVKVLLGIGLPQPVVDVVVDPPAEEVVQSIAVTKVPFVVESSPPRRMPLTKSHIPKKGLPVPEAESQTEGPESPEVMRTIKVGKKTKKIGRDDWANGATVKVKPEISVSPLAKCVKSDENWVPMDKESMAKFKEKRSTATTEKIEDAPDPVYMTRLKATLAPLDIEPILWQLQDAKLNGTVRFETTRQSGEAPEVWTCGQNSYGELAHLDTSTRKVFSFVEYLKDKDVVHVAAGNEHSVVLTRSGDIYTAGYNDNGQCGHGSTQRIGQLLRVDKLHGKGAVQVHAYNGCEHTLVVLRDGRLVSFGYNYRGQLGHGNTASEAIPKLVRGLENRSVSNVSCSYYHTVISCEDGAVFSFGRNDFGQLGHGDTTDRKVPRLVESLRGQRTTGLACGQYHTCVSTTDGRVLSCGKNDYGQLGVDSSENHRLMIPIYGLVDNEVICEVRCGYYHTIVLTKDGHVFGFGRNDYGQLGLGHVTPRVYGPNLIDQLEGKGIIRVAAGCYHSIVVGANGMLYVFGRNNHGQLGTGDTNEQHSPWPVDRFLGKRVAMVAAGFYHSIVLTGEAERDESSVSPVVEASLYSADFLLALPNFQLKSSQQSEIDLLISKDMSSEIRGTTENQPSVIENIDSSVRIESKEPIFPEEDDMHGNVLESQREISDARAAGLAVVLKKLAELDHTQCLVEKDGTIEPERAAIFILAHMDRLSSYCASTGTINFVDRQSQPKSAGAKQRVHDAVSGGVRCTRHLYCVDICPETFETLLALLLFLHKDMQTLPHFDEEDSASCYQQLYQPSMILACLRILTTNLAEFIQSAISSAVMGAMRAHREGEDQLNSFDHKVNRTFAVSNSDTQRHNILFGLPCIHINDSANAFNSDTSEVGRFRAVLAGLQRQLLALILEPVSIDAAELIQAEAAAILILGVELFYPSQVEKVNLLAELLATNDGPQEDPFEEGFHLGSATRTGRQAARHFILNPLLQRLAHDSLSSKLIPRTCASPQDHMQPSASVLGTLLRLLVKRMVTEASPPLEHNDPVEGPMLLHNAAPLPGQNQICTTQNNSGEETYTLLTEFLLTLQKHLMSWAGRQSSSDGCGVKLEEIQDSLDPNKNETYTTLDGSIRIATLFASSVPSGWNCLLEYSQMLLLHSIELLTKLLGCAGTTTSTRAPFLIGHRTGSASNTSFDSTSLRRSIVGSILPSLTTALLPFATEPIFAKRLMKLVTRFAQLLDALCTSSQDFRAIDTNYVRYRLGEGVHLNSSTGKVGELSGSRADNTVEVPKLPWLLSLLKTTASLAGRLASTMVIGNGNCHELLEARCASPLCEEWIKSPLFIRGLIESKYNLLARHGIISINTDDKSDSLHEVFRVDEFYSDLVVDDKSAKMFCQWLRLSYRKIDHSYNMLLHQVHRSSESSEFQTFENTMLAALLQSNGLSVQASLYQKSLSKVEEVDVLLARRMPTRFLALWRVVSEASTWIWRSCGQSYNGEDKISKLRYSTVSASILLNFKSPDLVHCPLSYVPNKPEGKSYYLQMKCSRACHRWRRAQCAVRAAIRWRRLYAQSQQSATISPLVAVLGHVTDISRKALCFVNDMTNISLKNRMSLQCFLLTVLESHRRAATRQHGLTAFHILLTSLKMQSLGIDILQSLAPALRIHTPSTGHYLARLDAIGSRPTIAVREAFTTLYAELLNSLDACISDDETSRTSSSIRVDSHQFLLLCDAWGLDYREADWPFIANVGVLDTLRKVITRLEVHLAAATSEPPANRSSASSIPPGRNRRNVSLALKHRERCLQQCVTSAWSLFRLITCQLAELGLLHTPNNHARHISASRKELSSAKSIPPTLVQIYSTEASSWFDLLSPCFDVFLAEINHGLMQMTLPPETQYPPPIIGEKEKAESQRPGHRRRCQEIITAPRRFVNMEDGMQIPAEQLLANSKGPDFSITFWLFLSHDSADKPRTILTRGHKNERWPVILLRDTRLEVAFGTPQSGITSAGELCEKLKSKDAIPVNKWTHVGLVSEANKLRLYLNGALDNPRNNCGVPHRANRHPLYIGKVPEGCVRLDGIRGGFEGSIAHLRYYTRALSPIHVRIVCDQGPPEMIKVKDRQVYQMCASLYLCAQSVHGKRHLSQRHWIEALFQVIIRGTIRVQQFAIRILRVVLPYVKPNDLYLLESFGESTSTSSSSQKNDTNIVPKQPLFTSVGKGGEGISTPAISLTSYLLRVIGLAVWRTTFLPASSSEGSTSLFLPIETIPCNVQACCLQGYGREKITEQDPTQQSGTLSMESLSEISALASEIVSLMRVLLACPTWCGPARDSLRKSLEGLKSGIDRISDSQTPQHAERLSGLAALCVLGGNSDSLRTGSQVSMSHTDMAATVIHYDESAGLAHVVMRDPPNRDLPIMSEATHFEVNSLKARGSHASNSPVDVTAPKSSRMVRINAEELIVHNNAFFMKADNALYRSSVELIKESVLPLVEILFKSDYLLGSGLEASSSAKIMAALCDAKFGYETSLFYAQCRSCCAKIMNNMGLCRNSANLFFDNKMLFESIIELAVQTDGSPQFTTLDEAEVRSVVLRRRLFQIMGHSEGDCIEHSAKNGGISTKPLVGDLNDAGDHESGTNTTHREAHNDDHHTDQIDQLVVMGFPEEWCLIALQENDNDVASASTWIVDNLDTLTTMNAVPIDEGGVAVESNAEREDKINSFRDANGVPGPPDLDSQQESISEASSLCEERDSPANAVNSRNGQQSDSTFFANVDVLLHENDRFDEEQAAIVYAENYFLSDPGNLPGSSYHGASSYGYGCGVGYGYGDSGLPGYRPKTIISEVAGMDASQLFEADLRAESSLAILHARSTVLRILQVWSCSDSVHMLPSISPNVLVQLLKFMTLRGCQIPVTNEKSFAASLVRPEKALRRPFAIAAAPLNATTTFRPVISKMLDDEASRNNEGILAKTLLNSALDDLEAAAFIDVFVDTAWSSRNLCVSDSQATLQPNVELAWWILDLLLSKCCVSVLHGKAFFRLSNCLRSANMPIKEIVMRGMSRIIVVWCDVLEARGVDDDMQADHHNEIPKKTIICELIQKSVPHAKLQCAAMRRIAAEQREMRLVYSRYVHAMIELLISLNKVESLVTCSTGLKEGLDTEKVIHYPAKIINPPAPQLIMATDSSISIGWTGNELHPASTFVRYELEIASQLPADNAIGSFCNVFTGMSTHFHVENLFPARTYHFRVRALAPGQAPSAWSPESSYETLGGASFCFDRTKSGPSIFVSGDGMQATYGSNESWKTIVGTEAFSCGRNHWEIKIESSSTAYLFIGVTTRRAELTTFLGGDAYGWGYIGDRALYHKRAKVKTYGERFGQGDVIGVTLDMDRGTLSFSKNGLDLGVAFDGLAGQIYPAVAFYNQGQQISLLPYSFMCPGAGLSIKDSPSSAGVPDTVELAHILGSMKTRQPISNDTMRKIYTSYISWSSNTTVRYMTRDEYELQFDTSPERCSAFGLQAWERVRTPRGNATVVGVANEQLWLHVDGERGAWFFASKDIKDGRALGYFVSSGTRATPILSITPTVGLEESKNETTLQESKDNDSGYSAMPKSARSRMRNLLSPERFREVADSPRWTIAADALIVRELNVYAEKYEVSPWNATPEQVLLIIRDAEARIQNAMEKSWTNVTVRSFRSAIVGRLAILRYFNHILVRCLPLIGLDDGLQLSSRPLRQESLWGEARESRGLAVNEHSSTMNEPSTTFSSGAGFGLSPLLCALRSSVFICTKKRLIDLAVKQTVTHAKKAEDDYDYPEDLPQVLLNRPKAAAAQSRTDPETRLSMSLFGQLFDELHFMEPALLRMGYTHPMDDGQERTFKVKFEGEGVDDYGGPYREIFSQLATEVQSCHVSAQLGQPTQLQEVAGCMLPLLCPSPNMRSDDAAGSDVLLVQPQLTRHLYLEMYNFLGQVLGMAMRSKVAIKVNVSSVFWKALVGQPVEEADLIAFDEATASMIKHLRHLLVNGSAEEIESSLTSVTWTTQLSNGVQIDLMREGSQTFVRAENCGLFLDALCHAHLHESDTALYAIRDGFCSVFPAAVLPLLAWEELERQICGKYEIDVKLLQANTEYDDDVSPEDDHILMFWRVLESFNHDERASFLRFVWARSRLPASAREFHQKFKIQAAVGDGPKMLPDTFLPKAHTCFFSLNLPRYSSEELMAERLRYAMYNCIEMDADFRLADSEMGAAWVTEDTAE